MGRSIKSSSPCVTDHKWTHCTLGKVYTLQFNNVIADNKTLQLIQNNVYILNHSYIPSATFNEI